MNIKTMMEAMAQEELERDGAACIDAMKRDLVDVIRCKHCAVERDLHGGCPMMGGTVTDDMFYFTGSA